MIIFSEASFSKYEGFRLFHLATGLLPPVSGIDLCRRGISGTSATNSGAGIDYYALCVRHPVPFTRPKIVHTTYPKQWMAQYQSANYFAIDPVLKPENFIQGHLPGQMNYSRMRRNYGQRRITVYERNNAVPDAA
jgi:hypothetical protein